MSCVEACPTTPQGRMAWPLERVAEEGLERVRDRQAAVSYLKAAELTENRTAREQLRRRGADLLLRHLGLTRRRLPC